MSKELIGKIFSGKFYLNSRDGEEIKLEVIRASKDGKIFQTEGSDGDLLCEFELNNLIQLVALDSNKVLESNPGDVLELYDNFGGPRASVFMTVTI
jgi:hypothetical protein